MRVGSEIYAADRIFDGHQFLADHAVVIEDNKVARLIPKVDLDASAEVQCFPGCTIIPGLIDMHMHFMRWQRPGYLAYGVTTVRDTGNDLDWILRQRRLAEKEGGPRILCLGPLLEGPTPFHPEVSRPCHSPAAAVTAVKETLEAGTDGIKFYVGLPVEWLPDMVRVCHEDGSKASIHCGGSGLRASMCSGVDEFYHLDGVLADVWSGGRPPGWLDVWGHPGFAGTRDAQCRLADDILAAGIAATPTLAYWHSQWRTRTPVGHGPESAALTPDFLSRWQGSKPDPQVADQWRRAFDAALAFTGRLIERNVPVFAGTDVPCGAVPPGLSLWLEMQFLWQAGMTTAQALSAATGAGADFANRPDLGHLRPGAVGELVVVGDDLSEAIPQTPDIRGIRHGGRWRPADGLREEAHAVAAAASEQSEAADPWTAQFRAHDQNQ